MFFLSGSTAFTQLFFSFLGKRGREERKHNGSSSLELLFNQRISLKFGFFSSIVCFKVVLFFTDEKKGKQKDMKEMIHFTFVKESYIKMVPSSCQE